MRMRRSRKCPPSPTRWSPVTSKPFTSKSASCLRFPGRNMPECDRASRFIAWDGYIHGILLGVDEGRRIVQTWRTSEFPPEARDSRLVVEFEPARGGTRVIVRHSDLPSSHVKKYERGWTEHYLKALARYFAKGAKPTPASRAPETT